MVIDSDKAIGGGRPEMESTISAFSANETALDSTALVVTQANIRTRPRRNLI